MNRGDRVRVDLVGFGTVRAACEDRVSVTLDGYGWITVPPAAVRNVGVRLGDTITELDQLKALPKGAMVAAGDAVNVALGDQTFTMILHGNLEIHAFQAWMLHRPCTVIHYPTVEPTP